MADFNPGPGTFYLTPEPAINLHPDIFILKLSQCDNTYSELNMSTCGSYTSLSGLYTWTDSGTYSDTIPNNHGCDSIITINLTVNNSSVNTISQTACDSYTSPSGNYTWTSSGSYPDTLMTSAGCDSVITVGLTVLNSTAITVTEIACDNFTSPSGNNIWTTSGTYYDTLINSLGCDSVITINLNIYNTASTIFITTCNSYTSPSGNYTWNTPGLYTDTLVNSLGCDSIITINLSISNSIANTITATVCNSYTSPGGNSIWTTSGTFTDTLVNSQGCDSIITIDLTVFNSSSNTISPAACESYTSPSGNYTWTTSGTFTDTLVNSQGCDSIITINLSILNSSSGIFNQTACDSFVSPSGNYSWSATGIYSDTLLNSLGCDSIITINLNIFNSSSNTFSSTVCESYTSPSGIYTWTTSGSYNDTLVNSQGCDSVLHINLTVNTVNTSVTDNSPNLFSNAAGATYQWIYCDSVPVQGETNQSFTAIANGIYAVIVTENGCIDTSECVTINNIYINEYDTGNNIYIYPNPTNGSIIIDFGSENADSEITLINSIGQVVSNRQERSSLINRVIEGGCGLYFVIIRTGDKTFGFKIVKNQ
jgi:hypothetical protein